MDKDLTIYTENIINVDYKHDFLKDADKYYDILDKELEYYDKDKTQVLINGKYIPIPRDQVAYGDLGKKYNFAGTSIDAKNWNDGSEVSKVILEIKQKIEEYKNETFNFVLINKYKDGSRYIGPHYDDERDLVDKSSIVGISLGAARDMKLDAIKVFSKNSGMKIKLKHGSLFSINYPTNSYWKHSIPKDLKCNKPRISLTFRNMV